MQGVECAGSHSLPLLPNTVITIPPLDNFHFHILIIMPKFILLNFDFCYYYDYIDIDMFTESVDVSTQARAYCKYPLKYP